MGVATLGVMFMSLPPGGKSGSKGAWMGRAVLSSRAAWLGLASGAGFAFSAVGYRGAALAMQDLNPGMSPWLIGAWGVLLAQTLQSLLLGAWLGWQMLPVVVLMSAVVGAVVGVMLIVAAGRGRGYQMPFGPYLAAAGFIALLWGKTLNTRYLGIFVGAT